MCLGKLLGNIIYMWAFVHFQDEQLIEKQHNPER